MMPLVVVDSRIMVEMVGLEAMAVILGTHTVVGDSMVMRIVIIRTGAAKVLGGAEEEVEGTVVTEVEAVVEVEEAVMEIVGIMVVEKVAVTIVKEVIMEVIGVGEGVTQEVTRQQELTVIITEEITTIMITGLQKEGQVTTGVMEIVTMITKAQVMLGIRIMGEVVAVAIMTVGTTITLTDQEGTQFVILFKDKTEEIQKLEEGEGGTRQQIKEEVECGHLQFTPQRRWT